MAKNWKDLWLEKIKLHSSVHAGRLEFCSPVTVECIQSQYSTQRKIYKYVELLFVARE